MKELFSIFVFTFICVSASFGQLYLLDDFKLEDCNDKLGVYSDIDVSVYPYQIYFDMETYDPNEKVLMKHFVQRKYNQYFLFSLRQQYSLTLFGTAHFANSGQQLELVLIRNDPQDNQMLRVIQRMFSMLFQQPLRQNLHEVIVNLLLMHRSFR